MPSLYVMARRDLFVILLTASTFLLVKAEFFTGKCNTAFYRKPDCVDTSVEYQCECGPGFEWNSKLCVSKSIDSRLEYLEREPVRYTLLLGKNFPALTSFTIACWLKRISDEPPGTLLSYAVGTKEAGNQEEELQLTIGIDSIRLTIKERVLRIPSFTIEKDQWTHLAIKWEGDKDGKWTVYKNGQPVGNGRDLAKHRSLTYGGRLIIGQSAEDSTTISFTNNVSLCRLPNMNECPRAFQGEVSYLNVWGEPLNDSYILGMFQDCTFTYCGDAVEWVDFRSGTRGALKLRWPSKIFQGHEDECQIDKEAACDNWCTHDNGPICDQAFSENIKWPRTSVQKEPTATVTCPGVVLEPRDPDEDELEHSRSNKTPKPKSDLRNATRYCIDRGNFTAVWGKANVTACLSNQQRQRLQRIQSLANEKELSNKTLIIILLDELRSSSKTSRGRNPTDLAADIEAVGLLVRAQDNTLNYSESDQQLTYPRFNETVKFAQTAMEVLNNTVDNRKRGINFQAWKETVPRGTEAVQVLGVVNALSDLLVKSLVMHVKRHEVAINKARVEIFKLNLALVVGIHPVIQFNQDVTFPRKNMPPSVKDGRGEIIVPGDIMADFSEDDWPEYIGISNARFNTLSELLPNHPEPYIVQFYSDKDKEFLHLEDNVNTVVISARAHMDDGTDAQRFISMTNESDPIEFTLKFIDTRNYSHPQCVSIQMDQSQPEHWMWDPEGCEIVDHDRDANMAICQCQQLGIFAIITDMYDPDWDPGDPPRFKMNAASYIGILISVAMYIISLVTYIYLRCETDTVAIHRNLAASIVTLQLSFLIGVGRTENEIVCKIFAIILHFFLLSSFLWVCNEAFNLYVEVSNTIHTDTQQQRPMLRYYVIGWGAPAVIVAALVNVKWSTYFSPDVCLIDVQHIWFLAGPCGSIWIITVFVLVYTGKDIMESSYSKDREANKIIANHCKGCWIQNMLLMIAMAFAICSAIMYSRIPQILFAMFTILQGAFFFMFFCVLNGEVVELLAERRTSLGISVASPSLPRSTKYSVYKRYVPLPIRSTSRRASPTHTAAGGSSPRPEKKQKTVKVTEPSDYQTSDDRGGSPSAGGKGHRTLTTVSSSDSRTESPLLGLGSGSATLVRKLMPGILKKPAEEDREETDLASLALRSDSPDQEQPVSKDMVTTV